MTTNRNDAGGEDALAIAQRLACCGYPVGFFPPGSKTPRNGGVKSFTTNPAALERWRAQYDDCCNVAVTPRDGEMIVDVDLYKLDGEARTRAEAAVRALIESMGCTAQQSARGGLHLVTRDIPGFGSADVMALFGSPGEVKRPMAGYVMAVGSTFGAGTYTELPGHEWDGRAAPSLPDTTAPAHAGDAAQVPLLDEPPHARIPRASETTTKVAQLRRLGTTVKSVDPRRWDEHDPWLNEWFFVCHHETGGTAEGLELCLEVSALFANCDFEDIRYRWGTLGQRGGPVRAMGTLVRVVQELLGLRGTASVFVDNERRDGGAHRVMMLGEFVMDAGPVSFLWRGLIPAGAIGSLLGQPNSGKSAVAVAIAMALASGRDSLLGAKLERHGAVLYIVAEGVVGMKNRMRAFAEEKLGADPAALPVVVLPGATDLNDSVAMDALAAETRDALAAWASEHAADVPPPLRLVVVDTKARNTGDAEENSSRDQAKVLNNCIALQLALNAEEPPTVLMLTHPPHAGMRERGSTAAAAGYDFRLELHVTNEQAGGINTEDDLGDLLDMPVPVGAVRRLAVAKQRDGTTELGVRLRFVQTRPTWMRRDNGESDTVVMLDPTPVSGNGAPRAADESLESLATERRVERARTAKRRDNDALLDAVLFAVHEAELAKEPFDRDATTERIAIGATKMDKIVARAKDEKLLRVEGTRGPYKLTPGGRKRIRSASRD